MQYAKPFEKYLVSNINYALFSIFTVARPLRHFVYPLGKNVMPGVFVSVQAYRDFNFICIVWLQAIV